MIRKGSIEAKAKAMSFESVASAKCWFEALAWLNQAFGGDKSRIEILTIGYRPKAFQSCVGLDIELRGYLSLYCMAGDSEKLKGGRPGILVLLSAADKQPPHNERCVYCA